MVLSRIHMQSFPASYSMPSLIKARLPASDMPVDIELTSFRSSGSKFAPLLPPSYQKLSLSAGLQCFKTSSPAPALPHSKAHICPKDILEA